MDIFPFPPLIQSLLIIALFIIGGKVLTVVSQRWLMRWARRTATTLDDIIISKIRPPFSYVIWLFGAKVALNPLRLESSVLDKIVNTIILVVLLYVLMVLVDILWKGVVERIAHRTQSTLDDALLPLASKITKSAIIIIIFMWILRVWNIDIAPVLASLGIAGLALGLAIKDSLANIFGGISLILDRTIKVGDKVKLESGERGYIVDMGLRSTKLRTFDNELITIPNGQLANSRVQNYGQPDPTARIVIDFGVGYDSDVDRVRKIVYDTLGTMQDVLSEEGKQTEVLFVSMEDYYLKFSARIWVDDHTKVWKKKLEATDRIFKALTKEGITIPFPTNTVYLEQDKS